MEDPAPPDTKQSAVLTAAMGVFAQYGYRRTSMEDIARAAGMSRPALYQHFRNKEAIARALIAGYFDTVSAEVAAVLKGDAPVPVLLARAFEAKAGPAMRPILDSPHGQELLDAKATLAADAVATDIAQCGIAKLTDIFAEWLTREAQAGRVSLPGPAEETAGMLLRSLDGIKRPPYDSFTRERDALAHLLGRGLAV